MRCRDYDFVSWVALPPIGGVGLLRLFYLGYALHLRRGGARKKQSLSKLWTKLTDGTITGDIAKGFEGGLEGYRQVRDNAPWYARGMLKVSLTAVEMGATAGMSKGIDNMYDMFSGAFLDTQPTSVAGYVGYYGKQYVDAFYVLPARGKNYNSENLIPF